MLFYQSRNVSALPVSGKSKLNTGPSSSRPGLNTHDCLARAIYSVYDPDPQQAETQDGTHNKGKW